MNGKGQRVMSSPIPELERLNVFIGRWLTEGETVAEDSAPAAPIIAGDVYEWVPGGHFVMHPAYGRIGSMAVGGLEVIGFDASTGSFRRISSTAKGTPSARPCRIAMASGRGRGPTFAVEQSSAATAEH